MTEVAKRNRPWWQWVLWGLLGLLILLVVVGLGGYLWLRSSAGLGFIEDQIEGRALGPIAGVEVDGLSGNPFDALQIDELRVRDPEGVWMIIRDLEVDYAVMAIRNRHVDIEDIIAREIEVLRRPELIETEPSESEPFRVSVERAVAETIRLREPVLGEAAELRAEGAFALRPNGSMVVKLDADRLDAPGEGLDVDFARDADGTMTGDFDLVAPADGPFATLMRAPDGVDVAGTGAVRGSLDAGQGDIAITFDGARVADVNARWTAADAVASGTIEVGAWPAFEAISSRTGDTLRFAGDLDRTTDAFAVDVSSPDLTLNAKGVLPEEGGLPERATIDLMSDTPTKLLPLPEGYRFGRVRATGDVTRALSFDGDVALSAVTTPYFDAGTISAPVTATRRDDGTFDVSTTARLRELITKQALPIALGSDAVVRTVFNLNPDAQRMRVQTFELNSGGQTVTGKGSVRYGDTPQLDLSGRADVRTNAIGAVPPGALVTEYTLRSVEGVALPAVTAQGSFVPDAGAMADGPVALAEIIGERVNFEVEAQPLEAGALRLDRAMFAATNVNGVVRGTVGDTLDLRGEATLLNPVTVASATLGEGSEASLTVAGARLDPDVRVDATLPTLALAGQTLNDARVRADVGNVLSNPRGPVQIEAQTDYGPLVASANLASEGGLYAASDIDVSLAGFTANGDVNVVDGGLYAGRLVLDLPRDGDSYGEAVLVLAPVGGEQGVELSAEAREVTVAGYDIAALDARASGTLEALTGTLALKGREDQLLGRQLVVDSPFSVSRANGVYRAELSPEGSYGGLEFAPRGVVSATYGEGRLGLSVPMRINSGTIDLDYAKAGTDETLTASMKAIPVQTFPLPVGFGETQGTVSGTADIQSGAGRAPTGRATVTLADFRGRLADAGEGLTLDVDAVLEAGALVLALDDGGNEFDIDGRARVPLTRAETLSGLRLDGDAPLSARLDASGPAARLFNIFAPEDSDPAGVLQIAISAQGTANAPQLSGTANGRDIRFEAPVAGTAVRNGRFAAAFTRNSVTITDVYAEDRKDGRIRGGGAFELVDGSPVGELEVTMTDFRALDRRDYEGRVGGTLAYVSTTEKGVVRGDLLIEKAEVKQIVGGAAEVVELRIDREVGEREHKSRIQVARSVIPIELDIKVRAPRKIFIRARGIDMEASLDIAIKGTISEPLIYGEAEVIRGGLTIASKELEFDEGGITFNGPISESRINLEATANTPTLTATVAVTGTVETPEIELSSTPERPEDEILSALLFGRSATQLSALEAAQLAQGLATLSGSGGGFDIVGGLRDALGFSSLDVGVDDDGNALVSGGRYLAKDVYLELFTGAERGAGGGAIISWEVRPDIVLRSKLGTDNEQAFSVLYEKDF